MSTDDDSMVPYAVCCHKDMNLAEVRTICEDFLQVIEAHDAAYPDATREHKGDVMGHAIAGLIGHLLADHGREEFHAAVHRINFVTSLCYNQNQHLKLRGGSAPSTKVN